MKYLQIIGLAIFLNGCDVNETNAVIEPAPQESETGTDSFSVRNAEILDDILTKLVESNIPHWINDDGSVGFQLSDAEEIDGIYYRARGEYAARN